jgi:hypothetical protein
MIALTTLLELAKRQASESQHGFKHNSNNGLTVYPATSSCKLEEFMRIKSRTINVNQNVKEFLGV